MHLILSQYTFYKGHNLSIYTKEMPSYNWTEKYTYGGLGWNETDALLIMYAWKYDQVHNSCTRHFNIKILNDLNSYIYFVHCSTILLYMILCTMCFKVPPSYDSGLVHTLVPMMWIVCHSYDKKHFTKYQWNALASVQCQHQNMSKH